MTSLRGVIDESIMYYSENPYRKLIWHTPPQLKELHFSKDTNIKSGVYPVPGLIWISNNNRVSLYAYTEYNGIKTKLYKAPFYNVNNSVCFGGASHILSRNRNTTFKGFTNYIETVFWESKFTHGDDVVQGYNYLNLMEDLLATSALVFPADALIPSENTILYDNDYDS